MASKAPPRRWLHVVVDACGFDEATELALAAALEADLKEREPRVNLRRCMLLHPGPDLVFERRDAAYYLAGELVGPANFGTPVEIEWPADGDPWGLPTQAYWLKLPGELDALGF